VIEQEAWREFVTANGQHFRHRSFRAFAEASPLAGLGSSIEFLERLCGDDAELRRLLREVTTPPKHLHAPPKTSERTDEEEPDRDIIPITSKPTERGTNVGFLMKRLAETDQELYMRATLPKEDRDYLSPSAASMQAGLIKRRVSVRTDDPALVVEFVRTHFPPEQRRQIAALLLEEEAEDADEEGVS
jgi:hypothetical protein